MRSTLACLLGGVVIGAGATGGAALLLYTQRGFLATAGFLVALSFAAVAAGVWAGSGDTQEPAPPDSDTAHDRDGRTLDGARAPAASVDDGRSQARRTARAWTAVVLANGAAAAFAAAWLARPSLRDAAYGGAAAVLFILAGPAYTSGQALARTGRGRSGAAAAALCGTAAGVLLAANWGIPRLDAPFLFLAAALAAVLAASFAVPTPPAEASVQQQVVLVTGVGAEGQIGYAIARRFIDDGALVAVTDVAEGVEALAGQLGAEVHAVRADLTREEEAERLIAAVLERFGRIDALVNVAGGLTVSGSVEGTAAEAWSREFDRNATTTFIATRAALPSLRRSRGAVVCFTTPAVDQPSAGLAAYTAAKSAVTALMRALAEEERPHGVRVNAVAPGMADTATNRAEAAERARLVSREAIADVVLFLCSDAARGVSGETLRVLGETTA